MLQLNKVNKKIGSNVILNDITFKVETNNIIGLAGPSGGGKSTLLRCIQQLDQIDSGSCICSGKTGFMFQDFQLFPHMTVLQNITYAPRIHNKNKNHNELAMSLLNQLGIQNKMHCFPQQLSWGQKQRASLARSLMMQPDILLCDEPTSGLDVMTISDVIALLQSIRAMNVTMIIASHDLDFLSQLADYILILKNGRIVANFAPKNMCNPIESLRKYYTE